MVCECLHLHCQVQCEHSDRSNYMFVDRRRRGVELKRPQNLLLRARKQKVGGGNCWKGEKLVLNCGGLLENLIVFGLKTNQKVDVF